MVAKPARSPQSTRIGKIRRFGMPITPPAIVRPASRTSEGHPAPVVHFTEDTVGLAFAVRACDESFQPPPPALRVALSRPALQLAVAQAHRELTHFAQRLRAVSEAARLGVEAIDKLLIWDNGNYD